MKLVLVLSLLFISIVGVSQSTYPIRADKVVIEKVGGNAELVLKNATRDSLHGILINTGAGQTAFAKVRLLNDSTLIIAFDTIKIKGAYAKPVTDVTQFVDYTNEVKVDTSYSTTCGVFTSFDKFNFPEFIGAARVRVSSGFPLCTEDICVFGTFYTWDSITGTLRIFPAYSFTGPETAATITIQTY